jgi:hypothetical protein
MTRVMEWAAVVVFGALLGVGICLLPAAAGQRVGQCVTTTEGGYCHDYVVRSWPGVPVLVLAGTTGAAAAAA